MNITSREIEWDKLIEIKNVCYKHIRIIIARFSKHFQEYEALKSTQRIVSNYNCNFETYVSLTLVDT